MGLIQTKRHEMHIDAFIWLAKICIYKTEFKFSLVDFVDNFGGAKRLQNEYVGDM